MAGSGLVLQSCSSTGRMSSIEYSIRFQNALTMASAGAADQRVVLGRGCHGRQNRRLCKQTSALKHSRISCSSGDKSPRRSAPHAQSQSHPTHGKLQAATGRQTQTAPDETLLTVDATISHSQSSLQSLESSDQQFRQVAESEEINKWIDTVRSQLRHLSHGEATSVDRILLIVDRLDRLGISRYYEKEIIKCLQDVNKYRSNDHDLGLERTATAFRLLRTHGFDVTEDLFKRFYKAGEFEASEKAEPGSDDISAMLSLLRASQTLFPGESLLKEARTFTRNYLKRKHESNECGDLAGEVEYALKFPWYTSLPRLEHRAYIGQAHKDVDEFLRFAQTDFNVCQEMHKQELEQVIRWNASCKFPDLEFARQKFLECYFSAAANLFEPDMAQARVVWAQCYVLITVLDDYFDNCAPVDELRVFLQAVRTWDPKLVQGLPERAKILFNGLYDTVNAIAADAFITQGRDVSYHLRIYWDRWLTACLTESEWAESGYVPSFDEYMAIAEVTISLETIVCSAFFFANETITEEALLSQDYHTPLRLVCRVGRILNDITGIERETLEGKKSSVHLYLRDHPEASESDAVAFLHEYADITMQQLTNEVTRTTALPTAAKMLHLHMAKVMHTFYRDSDAYCVATDLLADSIDKVLFTPVPESATAFEVRSIRTLV